ncbi:2Fe-2S iron-sulfur cluster-binding protein [Undibacterium arcticum]|uniref:2Fe-2S iron-sulfur cluster-binding protein n=1 Tax=Undibacterium arcticum TaxID=1762892 RepID=A0ABV7EY69_9BURK
MSQDSLRDRYHALTIQEVIEESSDAKSLVFAVPDALIETFRYRPGQFLTLRIPHPDGTLARCYSLSSAPDLDPAPRVTIKRVQDGRASNWICDQLKAGDTLEVLPPAGVFVPRNLSDDFMLFAGGSGVTPILSIVKSLLARGSGRATVIYANRDERSVIFRNALMALASAHPQRLTVLHWLDSVQGIPSVAQLKALAAPWEASQYFICGPGPFMDGARAALMALEVPRERMHIERFVSLESDPTQITLAAPAASYGPATALEVVLDGVPHQVDGAAGESLLESMLRAGIAAPSSCRSGSCGACMCRLEEGEVSLRTNAILDSDDLADGWTLACQGVPASAKVRVRFPD